MSKFNSNKLASWLNDAGVGLKNVGKKAVDAIKDPSIQRSALAALSSLGLASLYIKHIKKQAEEKEKLYIEKLAKHNAIIKELDAKAEMDKKRQDQLLAYDSKLKKEMTGLQAELLELKDYIAEFEKKKANDE